MLTLGTTFLGWLLVEVRGLRKDLGRVNTRLSRLEGRAGIEAHE